MQRAHTSMGSSSVVTVRLPVRWSSTVTVLPFAITSIAGMAPTKLQLQAAAKQQRLEMAARQNYRAG